MQNLFLPLRFDDKKKLKDVLCGSAGVIIGVKIPLVLSLSTIYPPSLYVTNSFAYFTLVNALLMCREEK